MIPEIHKIIMSFVMNPKMAIHMELKGLISEWVALGYYLPRRLMWPYIDYWEGRKITLCRYRRVTL